MMIWDLVQENASVQAANGSGFQLIGCLIWWDEIKRPITEHSVCKTPKQTYVIETRSKGSL